jgi:hypothetical protein
LSATPGPPWKRFLQRLNATISASARTRARRSRAQSARPWTNIGSSSLASRPRISAPSARNG